VNIPELPGSYRPGDVVGGFVLTERGHWVPVDSPRAGNLRRRRFLSTQVSTLRDPDKPSSELSPQQARAAADAAARAEAVAAHAPVQGPTAGQGAPSSATPPLNPYLSGKVTPRAARGGPTATPKPKGSRRGCIGCLAVLAIAIGVIVPVGRGVLSFIPDTDDPMPIATEEWDWGSEDEDTEWELPAAPEVPSYQLTEEEAALIELVDWEVWHSEYSSHFVLTVAAPGLERPQASVSVSVEAVDADGVTHEGSDFIALDHGAPVVALGFFPEAFDAEVVDLHATFTPVGVDNDEVDYEASVVEGSVDSSSGRPWVEVTIAGTGTDEPPATLRLAVVVRDADGKILNLGVTYPTPPAPGDEEVIEFPLWGPETVSGSDQWEFTLMRR